MIFEILHHILRMIFTKHLAHDSVIMSRTRIRVNLHTLPELFDKLLAQTGAVSDSNRIRTRNHLVYKRTLNHLAKLVPVAIT